MTAKTRLLATDLTTPGLLDPSILTSICLPAGITNQDVKETRLTRDVYVQILDIENLSKSRWEQVEELEAIERGEQTRGREVIRLPVGGDENNENEHEAGNEPPAAAQPLAQRNQGRAGGTASAGAPTNASAANGTSKNATHKLVLQDCKGQRAYGLELKRMERIAIGKTNIGEKLLLKRGTVVARGVILLEPTSCEVLGGKVEAWQKSWVEGRLARLRQAVGAGRRD